MSDNTDTTPAESTVNNGGQTQEPEPVQNGDTGQSLSSADLANMSRSGFNERIKAAKESGGNEALTALFKAIGVEGADDLKARFAKLTELEEKHLTEQEKAEREAAKRQQEFEALAAEREAAKAEAEKATEALQKYRTRQAILEASTKAKEPEDVWLWASSEKGQELLAKVWTSDGAIDTDAVKALVDACAKDKPHYFGGWTPGSPSNKGATPPTRQDIEASTVLKKRAY